MNFWKVLFFLPLFCTVGCDLLDRDETIPAFLRVDSVELLGGISGSDFCFDNKVYNVEVYIGGENIGIYALGTDIPVFFEGATGVEIFALVPFAGSSQILEPHLFLQKIEFDVDFQSGLVSSFDLTASYFDGLTNYISEDFENSPYVFSENVDEDSLSGLDVELNDFCANNHVGAFHLTDSSRLSVVTTNNIYQIANVPSNQAYLELDYFSEINLTISLYTFNSLNGDVGFSDLYYVNPKSDWNRLYINMTDFIQTSDADRFQLLISAELPVIDALGDTLRTGSAYLDNIRVISF